MAHIKIGNSLPGILGLLYYKPSTGKALSRFTQTLMRGPSSLTSSERELIAAHVSSLNDCTFCHRSHAAAATAYLEDDGRTTACMMEDLDTAPLSDRMKALLRVAAQVQQGGRRVAAEHVLAARQAGASDEDLHDTVLVAAAFCMFNRYVDGLGTSLPASNNDYVTMGQRLASKGYGYPPFFLRKFVVRMMEKTFSRDRRKAEVVAE